MTAKKIPALRLTPSRKRAFTAALSAVGILLASHPASANTISWTGTTDTTWATGTNWTGGIAPTNDPSSDIALFNQTTYTNQPNAGTTSINGLLIGDGSTSTGALTLSGTSLTIGSSGISMLGNAGTATISSPITLAAAQTWSNASANTLTISGTVANGGFLLTSGGSGNTTISGIISGTGGLTKTGSGTLTLSTATNTFSGGLTISGGTLSYDSNVRLGGTSGTAGAVTIDGGTLKTTNTASITNTHAITIGSNGGTINVAGTATSAQNSRIIFGTANTLLGSGALTITGRGFVDAAGGSGTVVLNAANNGVGGYSGNITLQNGGMLTYEVANGLASAATVTLNNNTEFAVVNNVTTANNITVNGGTTSTLSFINGNAGVFSGAITLNANATVGLRDWYNNNTVRSGTISGNVTGTGGLIVNSGTGASAGTLTLSGTNSYSGNTTINGAAVAITGNSTGLTGAFTANANGTVGSTLTLNGNTGSLASNATINLNGGTFNYQNTAAGTTLDASTYTFGGIDRTYQATYGTSGTTVLNLASATRTAGTTNNYVTSGGTNGTSNKITFTSAPATGFVDKGDYFGGTSYLAYDSTGFARAYDYTNDLNGVTSTGGLTLGTVTGKNVDLTTAAVTAQTTDSINTLRLGTTNGVTMASSSDTLSVDGILKSGGNAATIATGNITTTTSGGEMVIRTNASGDSLTISSIIANNGGSSLTKTGLGTLALNAANTYAGGTSLSGGIVTFNNNTSFGTGSITAAGVTIRNTAGVTTTNNLVVNGLTTLDVSGGNWTLNGNISGSGDILRGASAALTLYLNGDNSSYAGTFTNLLVPTASNNAVVRFTNPNAGSANAKWVFNNTSAGKQTLEWTSNGGVGTISFGSLTGAGQIQSGSAGTKTISAGALNLNDNFAGTIANGTGTVALTKIGNGTMSLFGANTYTGATTVSSGTLNVVGSLASGSAVSVASGATLRGTGTVGGATTIVSGGTLKAGISDSSIGTLTFSSTLDTTGATVSLKLNSTNGTFDALSANGVTLGNATLSLTELGSGTLTIGSTFKIVDNTSASSISGTFSGLAEGGTVTVGSNTFTISYIGGTGNDITLTTSAIPEPATYAAAFGALALAGAVWNRRRSAVRA